MANFTLAETQAWLESSKLDPMFTSLDDELATQVTEQILSRLSTVFDVTTWTDETNTPKLIRSILAMHYVAWIYDKVYSTDGEDSSQYAMLLRSMANTNIEGLLSGVVILEEDPEANAGTGTPAFFPNDASSAQPASKDFPANGDAAFMMGMTF